MLVRIKKRGELPVHSTNRFGLGGDRGAISLFRGCCIEVSEPFYHHNFTCGGFVYYVLDNRVLALLRDVDGAAPAICEHSLIDDLNAYDSDSSDEQAEIGDLAMAEVVRPVEVKR